MLLVNPLPIFGKLIRKLSNSINKNMILGNGRLHLWLIILAFSLIAAYLVTPQFSASKPRFEIGTVAKQNIKADRDLLVEDKKATEKKVLEALKDSLTVYDLDPYLPAEIIQNLTKAFFFQADLPKNTNGLGDLEKILNISIRPEEFEVLKRRGFAPEIAERISQIIGQFYRNSYFVDGTLSKPDHDRGIVIRNIKTQAEEEVKDLSGILTMKDTEARLRKIIENTLREETSPVLTKVVSALSQRLLRPNLTFNRELTELKKQNLIKEIKPAYFQVLKNEVLVREGQKISEADTHKLEAYFSVKTEKITAGTGKLLIVFFLLVLLTGIIFHGLKVSLRWKVTKADILLLIVTALMQIVLARIGIFIAHALNNAFPFIPAEAGFYAIPFGMGTMLIAILINPYLALIFVILSVQILGFLFEGKLVMILFIFIGNISAIGFIRDCRTRSAFFKSGLFLGAINSLTVLFISLFAGETGLTQILFKMFMGMIGGILAGFIAAGMSPIFESVFGYTTDIKLLELANLNNPLLQQLILEAPGTYHHSIIVASLVEKGAESIGANSLLAKVSAYYHDLGKMKKPQYFIENQSRQENRHDHISPKMSSLVIISHVKEGCELASKMKLGREITDIIRQHHGTSLVSYFWEKAKREGDPSLNSFTESDFRYPGPKPQTREAGLVLLGDVIEASSRTLSNPTPSRISNLVRERIEKIFTAGQLDECELTLRDLNLIAESFTRILNGIFHKRIDYPEPGIRPPDYGTRKESNGHPDRKPSDIDKIRLATY